MTLRRHAQPVADFGDGLRLAARHGAAQGMRRAQGAQAIETRDEFAMPAERLAQLAVDGNPFAAIDDAQHVLLEPEGGKETAADVGDDDVAPVGRQCAVERGQGAPRRHRIDALARHQLAAGRRGAETDIAPIAPDQLQRRLPLLFEPLGETGQEAVRRRVIGLTEISRQPGQRREQDEHARLEFARMAIKQQAAAHLGAQRFVQHLWRHVAHQRVAQYAGGMDHAIQLLAVLGDRAHRLRHLLLVTDIGGDDDNLMARGAQTRQRLGGGAPLDGRRAPEQDQPHAMAIGKMLGELQPDAAKPPGDQIGSAFIEGTARHALRRRQSFDDLGIAQLAAQGDDRQAIARGQLAEQLLPGHRAAARAVEVDAARVELRRLLRQRPGEAQQGGAGRIDFGFIDVRGFDRQRMPRYMDQAPGARMGQQGVREMQRALKQSGGALGQRQQVAASDGGRATTAQIAEQRQCGDARRRRALKGIEQTPCIIGRRRTGEAHADEICQRAIELLARNHLNDATPGRCQGAVQRGAELALGADQTNRLGQGNRNLGRGLAPHRGIEPVLRRTADGRPVTRRRGCRQ